MNLKTLCNVLKKFKISIISTGNTQSYDVVLDQELGPSKAITFTVSADNDAHVGFFSGNSAPHKSTLVWDEQSTSEVYEIVISGMNNDSVLM